MEELQKDHEADNTLRLMYPSGHSITRFDQAKFDLWSVAMSDLKLISVLAYYF